MSDPEWWNEGSGPYVIQFADGSRRTEVDTRMDVFSILDAMDTATRQAIRVIADWREDDGEYVHDLLKMQEARDES